MLEGKKVIIFDLDGTLIDSVGMWNDVDEILISRLSNGKTKIPNIGQYRDKYLRKVNNSDIYMEYCKHLKEITKSSLKPEAILSLRHNISEYYEQNVIDYKKDADKVLHTLNNQGYKLVLATTTTTKQLNSYQNYNKNMMKKARLNEIFSLILSREDIIHQKPNPEIHNKILRQLNVTPTECLIVEDSLIGVEAANNAGIEVAVIYDQNADPDREKINIASNYQFDNFTEFLHILTNKHK